MDFPVTHQPTVDSSQKENVPPEVPSLPHLQQDKEPKESRIKPKGSSIWFKRAEKMAAPGRSSPHVNDITNDLTRGAPTDGVPESHVPKSPSQQELARRRNQYYDDAFAVRETHNTLRNKVNQDAVIVVRVTTNITIPDQFQAVSELSCHLSIIFQRPETSIMIILEHSTCLMLAGTYEPAYHATMTALPHLIGPVTNLRNTVLIQGAIRDTLSIPERRGVVKFESIPDENLGTNGVTFKDEIDNLEKKASGSSDNIIKSLSRTMSRKIRPPTSRINTAPPATASAPEETVDGVEPGTATTTGSDLVRHTQSLPIKPLEANITTTSEHSSKSNPNHVPEPETEKEEPAEKEEKSRTVKTYKSIKRMIFH